MTSKLKCPFCGAELDKDISGEFGCPNEKCKKSMFLIGTEEMWLALIQAKQDLEIARNALKELRGDRCLPAQTPWEIIADKALEHITHDNSEKANSGEHKG